MLKCQLREIWRYSQKPLLPSSPSGKLGTVIHGIMQYAYQNRINSKEEFENEWKSSVERIQSQMLENSIERHLVPLEISAFNFEVKKILTLNMISPLFAKVSRSKGDKPKFSSEKWVQTPDDKAGGKIDLIKESPEGTEIIDFKTGAMMDKDSPGVLKEEYAFQIKMYAALYHAQNGIWPVRLTLVGLNNESHSIDVDPSECSGLLHDACTLLSETNELIEAGLKPEDFAQPSPDACRFCQFRPACSKYWKSRTDDKTWPADENGNIKSKTVLGNGTFRLSIETSSREITIRGLSQQRNRFLNDDVQEVLFCNLGNDRLEGHYLERMLTTGYAIK